MGFTHVGVPAGRRSTRSAGRGGYQGHPPTTPPDLTVRRPPTTSGSLGRHAAPGGHRHHPSDWVPRRTSPRDTWALAEFRRHPPVRALPTPRLGSQPDWGTLVFQLRAARRCANFLVANAIYWLEEFPHRPGLRVDAGSRRWLYLDLLAERRGVGRPNKFRRPGENLEAIAFLQGGQRPPANKRVAGDHDDRRGSRRPGPGPCRGRCIWAASASGSSGTWAGMARPRPLSTMRLRPDPTTGQYPTTTRSRSSMVYRVLGELRSPAALATMRSCPRQGASLLRKECRAMNGASFAGTCAGPVSATLGAQPGSKAA